MSLLTVLSIALAAGGPPALGSSSRFRPLPPADEAPPRSDVRTKAAAPANRQALPYARGRRFATLDDYLAFRREQGAIDLPWYEEVAPDVFLLRTSRRPQPAPQRFTRAELARKFGFARH